MRINQILAEYDSTRELYNDFRLYCENLLRQMLQFHEISVHMVQSRFKTRESLGDKIQRPDKNYAALTDVTDLAGIRVITYFDDDVDRVGKVVESEFEIDPARSVDKRKSLGTSQFGYSSLHYIASLSKERCGLVECRKFQGLRCEIQVRSILQHAWAEIEHDLGYKASSNVPDEIRRRFSRLAGTLEGADEDFRGIRDEIGAYIDSARRKILSTPSSLELDDITVRTLIEEDESVQSLTQSIAQDAGVALLETRESYPLIAAALRSVGFTTVKSVQDALNKKGETIRRMVVSVKHERGYQTLGRGFVLGNLYLVALAETADVSRMVKSFSEQGFFFEQDRKTEAERILRDFAVATTGVG